MAMRAVPFLSTPFPVQKPRPRIKRTGLSHFFKYREGNSINEHDLLEISFRVVRAIAFGADGFKPDGAGLPGHAYEVASVDVADLPDMHGLQVVGQEFRFR